MTDSRGAGFGPTCLISGYDFGDETSFREGEGVFTVEGRVVFMRFLQSLSHAGITFSFGVSLHLSEEDQKKHLLNRPSVLLEKLSGKFCFDF